MPITVRKFEAQVRDSTTGNMIPAGLLSSDALGAIDDAKDAAIDDIEAKGSETIASIPSDYTTLSTDVTDLRSALISQNLNTVYDYFKEGLYSSGGIWTAPTTANIPGTVVIPVSGGEHIYVEGAEETASSTIAALRSYNNPSKGDSVDFSTATGWTTNKVINSGESFTGSLPDDARYLAVYAGFNRQFNRMPKELTIDGVSIYLSAKEYIDQMDKDVLEQADRSKCFNVDTFHLETRFYSSSGLWAKYNESLNPRGLYIIPVNPGDKVIVFANDSAAASYSFLKDFTPPVVGEAIPFSEVSGYTGPTSVSSGTYRSTTAPSDGKYLMMQLGTAATNRIPRALFINGCDIMPTTRDKIVDSNVPIHLRVMQYNIGKYSYGDSSNPGLSADDYTAKLMNYRAMLCEYQPDLIGIEEFIEYIDAAQAHKADDVLFDYIFPYSVWNRDNQRNLKSKFPLLYQEVGTINGTISGAYAHYSYAKYSFRGKLLSVMCTAFTSGASVDALSKRESLIAPVLEKMAGDDYAIIVLDANNSGNAQGYHSWDELSDMITTLNTAGWSACNGEYLPYKVTCHSRTSGAESPIDNVFFKNNGKIIFNNFVVLANEYANLSSDHFPVYADFTLL